MASVVIDGVEYLPKDGSQVRVGIGVTTRNRNEIAAKNIAEIRRLTPEALVVVVDDASAKPFAGADYRFDTNVGIARAKNKCLELLYEAGVEHFFLFDDDCYPLVDGWHRPYLESPEPHLMWMFDRPANSNKRQLEPLYECASYVAYHATRGCLLYVTRGVLDRVGGMDSRFGLWGWEHQSWSDRIHSAGLTSSRYMDVPNSSELIYSMDQRSEVESTATDAARRFSEGPGLEHRMLSRHSDAYIEFRDLRDVVITTLLTSQDDPQRGAPLKADPGLIKALHDSLKHDGDFVVFHTGLGAAPTLPNATMVQVQQSINPYFERWVQVYQYLRENEDIGNVWCVDGTDVQMTRNPFPEMESGKLYFGYETTTLRDEWMLKNHPDATLQAFMKANPNLPLLNMGVIGGDRKTVMAFAHAQLRFFFDDHIDWIMGWETSRAGIGDMASGNYLARTLFSDRISTGPHVVNVFKSGKPSATAWWSHK